VSGSLAIKARSEFVDLRCRYLQRTMDHEGGLEQELRTEVESANHSLRVVVAEERKLQLAVWELTQVTISQGGPVVVGIETEQPIEAFHTRRAVLPFS
jgi:hypothetical protein